MKQLKGISFHPSGKVLNDKTGKELKITEKGRFIWKGKSHNLAKYLLLTFKGIEVRNGRIVHLDGNKANFTINNIRYASLQKKSLKPSENDLKNLLKIYFVLPVEFSLKDVFSFRLALSIIAESQLFSQKYKTMENIEIFREYIQYTECPSIRAISQKHGITIRDGQNIINYFLMKLIEETQKNTKHLKIEKSTFLILSKKKIKQSGNFKSRNYEL